ncbi:hypothetical protein SN15_05880 [Stenotrophomonas maltophilia]|nr:hypothetical protein SN15_05880 [Stenotrophomonas maltophilia]
MKHAAPHFPLSIQQRDLAIVGLAKAGGTVREIAQDVDVSVSTVRRVLKAAAVAAGWGYGLRKFLISRVEWDADGRVLKRLPSEGAVLLDTEQIDDRNPDEIDELVYNAFSDRHGYSICGCQVSKVVRA